MLYFEDFPVGRTFELGSICPDRDAIVRFAREFDPQPFHVDDEAASAGPYRGIIASGWHTCALVARQMVVELFGRSAGLGSPGMDELRWLKPVRPGDRLSVTATVLEARPSASKSDRGALTIAYAAHDQAGAPVITMRGVSFMRRRPAEA